MSCYLAEASSKTSKYFVTGNLVYLASINLIMPVLAGFVLPIVLAALARRGNIPSVSIPAEVIPVTAGVPSHLAVGTKMMIGIMTSSIPPQEPISVGTNIGLMSGNELLLRILDADTRIAVIPISSAARTFYSGTAAFFGLFANTFTVSIANQVSSGGLSSTDIGSSATASGLSAKDIINIGLVFTGAGALIWNYVQQSLCSYHSQS
jgi:hypothetical protein